MREQRAGVVVGRATELGSFERAIGRAAAGEPSTVLLSGDPGVGKSTLVAEAAARASSDLFVGRCVQIGGAAFPLAPVVDLVRHIKRRVEREAVPSLAPLADLVTSGSVGQWDLLSLAVALISELGRDGPVVVAFDDLHWGDPGTWDLFEYLARNLVDERVVLVGSFRPGEVERDPVLRRRVAELSRVSGVERIELAALDRASVALHVSALLGQTPSAALVDELLRRGEGNPFFTEELVAARRDRERIPKRLSDLLAGEVEALDWAARHVLVALAAVGRDTDPELLGRIVELDERAAEAAIRAAIAARLVVVDPATDTYRFRHPLVGEIAYAAALPTERRRMHRAIVSVLEAEATFAMTASDAAGERALHLERAGDEQGAFRAFFAAADAAEMIAPATCRAHLERLLGLWDRHGKAEDEPQHVLRLWQAADLANAQGDNRRAVELAMQAIAMRSVGDAYAITDNGGFDRVSAYERLGRFLWALGRISESAETYRRAAAILDRSEGDATASAYAGLAQGSLMFRQFDQAELWSRRALDVDPDDPASRSAAEQVLGIVEVMNGAFERGLQLCERSVGAPVALHRRMLATAYQATAHLIAGRTSDAVQLGLDGASVAQRAGFDGTYGAWLAGVAAHALVRLGRWDEAEQLISDTAQVEPGTVGAIGLDTAAAVLAARQGHNERANALIDRLHAQPADPWHQADIASATTSVRLEQRRWKDAMAAAAGALDPDHGTPRLVPQLVAGAVIAAVENSLDALARQEAIDVEGLADELRRQLEVAAEDPSTPAPTMTAELALADATVTRLTGSDRDAFKRAVAAAEDAGDRWMVATALAQESAAAAAAGDASGAVESLRRSHQLAVELRATPLLAQIAAIARRTRISLETSTPPILETQDVIRLGLTSREAEVLALVAAGRTNGEIGAELFVSKKTASVHVSNILRKLNVTSRVEAAAIAQRLGI